MYKRVILIAFIINVVFTAAAQEDSIAKEIPDANHELMSSSIQGDIPVPPGENRRNYLLYFGLIIADGENQEVVNSEWSKITRSGEPVTVNAKVGNLALAVIFTPYFVDEQTITLVSQGKIVLRHIDRPGGRFFSTIESIPLKLGEKALFFPLGLFEEKVENITSCVLQIEVQNYNQEEQNLIEPARQQNKNSDN